jgi:peptidoglycan hydrolase CwlO-like protein
MIWLLANWKLLLTGLAVGFLGVMLLTTQHKLHNRTNERDKAVAAYQLEVAKNAVQVASIDKLTAALDDQSAAVAKLSTDSDARTKAADQARIAAQEAARASNDTARALDASAAVARSKDGPCVPGETFLKHSGEL